MKISEDNIAKKLNVIIDTANEKEKFVDSTSFNSDSHKVKDNKKVYKSEMLRSNAEIEQTRKELEIAEISAQVIDIDAQLRKAVTTKEFDALVKLKEQTERNLQRARVHKKIADNKVEIALIKESFEKSKTINFKSIKINNVKSSSNKRGNTVHTTTETTYDMNSVMNHSLSLSKSKVKFGVLIESFFNSIFISLLCVFFGVFPLGIITLVDPSLTIPSAIIISVISLVISIYVGINLAQNSYIRGQMKKLLKKARGSSKNYHMVAEGAWDTFINNLKSP